MQLQPWMKAVLLTVATAGTMAVTGGSAQAHHRHHGCCGGCGGYSYYGGGCGGGGCGMGGCATGGCASGGCAMGGCATGGCPTGGCAPHAMSMSQPGPYVTQTGGCGPMTAAYPPAAPAPGQPDAYNGANYQNAPPPPTYAPGTYAPAPPVTDQRGNTAEQRSAAMPPATDGAPQPNGNAANPPVPAAPPSSGSTNDTATPRNP
jgi:hypothetical protein